ncbi:MAG TPA: homoserine dehydrogenase [Candidatus Aminicenantes bacterium]|nr:MAG: homoserine dehydrogenase [Candidatus Aminicenantes bacterium]HEK85641.1 homoserine dehydrogenase [Candidatus Aminicenantes bacterium]
MEKINIILVGFGRVGQAFFNLLREKYDYCRARYGLELELRGIVRNKGSILLSSTQRVMTPAYFLTEDLDTLADWIPSITLSDFLEEFGSGIVVDCTPSNLENGEPGFTIMKAALEKGWHVVTASKGALVLRPGELQNLSKEKNVLIKASGATAAALPTLDVGLNSLAGATIQAIEGLLNGTCNYILTRMNEGLSYDQALEEAQEKGIAERDPSLDVGGWDTAAKMILIANQVLGTEIRLSEAIVRGIVGITPEIIEKTRRLDKVLKLIGKCDRESYDAPWKVEVGLALLDREHPLAGINEANKGIIFYTDTMGWVAVSGGKSDPRGAAAALLKDIISIYWRA